MNNHDISEFIREITECCDPSDTTCNTTEDPCVTLDKVQANLKKFALEYKGTIDQLYKYAAGEGKYTPVDCINMIEMMDKYDQYHTDFITFIKAIRDVKNERVDNLDKFQELIAQAETANENFLKSTLGTEEVHTTFLTAIANIEVMVRIFVLINEAKENALLLSNGDDENDRLRVEKTVSLYIKSVTTFVTSITEYFYNFMDKMIAVMNGEAPKKPTVGDFKLI